MNISRRSFTSALGAGIALQTVAPALAKSATPVAPPFDPMPFVHPDLRPTAKMLSAMKVQVSTGNLANARASSAKLVQPPLATPAFREQIVPGHGGNPDVKVFVVNDGQRGTLRPAILHMHGGGFIFGSALGEMASVQKTALELNCVIVSVEYRLAPETPWSGSLEDNYVALKWLHANAESLGADRNRIAVMGGSAGGGHAAILAIAARDRGEVSIVFQALTYPMLDDRTGSTVQKPPQQGAILWTPEANRFGWTSFLGQPAGSRRVPAGSVPARERNLAGLPPTFIGVGSIDLFVDEDIAYAARLVDAGVPCELVVMPGGFHGFTVAEQVPVVQRYLKHYYAALRQGLA